MQAWQIVSEGGIDALKLADIAHREPGPGEVLVGMRANAINFRDLMTVRDPAPRNIPYPRVPNSDGAGEILAVGRGVRDFRPGDRVATCFFQRWIDGPCTPAAMASELGGAQDGVLAQEVVLAADGVVPIPPHMSLEEASTLPCAALTAWNAVVECGRTKPGDTVLLLGTGGVSLFALQFAKMMGARVILISSSDEKMARARDLGADVTINYRNRPDWETQVLEASGGSGVDLTVEVGGAGTLPRSIAATRVAGTIALIGVLTGGSIDPTAIMRKSIRLQGIYVGSRRMFLEMNRALTLHAGRPVIDARFAFADAPAAYRAMQAAAHFGKIVIAV